MHIIQIETKFDIASFMITNLSFSQKLRQKGKTPLSNNTDVYSHTSSKLEILVHQTATKNNYFENHLYKIQISFYSKIPPFLITNINFTRKFRQKEENPSI